MPVAAGGIVAHAILVVKSHVEPNRRVEGAILVDAQEDQFVVKDLAVFLGKIAVLDTPVCDGAADPMDQLAHGGSRSRVLLAIEVLGDDHLGGQWDQNSGTSTSFCLKTTLPLSSVISAVRFSHLTRSNGLMPSGTECALDDFGHKLSLLCLASF